jgi:hypothetical protein
MQLIVGQEIYPYEVLIETRFREQTVINPAELEPERFESEYQQEPPAKDYPMCSTRVTDQTLNSEGAMTLCKDYKFYGGESW